MFFSNEIDSVENEIILGECRNQNIETKTVETTGVDNIKLESKIQEPIFSNMFVLILILSKAYARSLIMEKAVKRKAGKKRG